MWTNKTKTLSKDERGRLLTPDSSQILVGASEDEVLIYQQEESFWTNKTKDS